MPYTHDIGSPVPKNRDDAPSVTLGVKAVMQSNSSRPSIGFEYSKYEHFLADSALSETEKEQVLSSLWSIVSGFIQLGFGVHPVQQALEAKAKTQQAHCGQLNTERDTESPDLVFSNNRAIEEGRYASE